MSKFNGKRVTCYNRPVSFHFPSSLNQYPTVDSIYIGEEDYFYSNNGSGFLTWAPEALRAYSVRGVILRVHNGLEPLGDATQDTRFRILDQEYINPNPPSELKIYDSTINLLKIEIPDPRTRGVTARLVVPWWNTHSNAVIPIVFSIFAQRDNSSYELATTINFKNFRRMFSGKSPRFVESGHFLSSLNAARTARYGATKVVMGSRFAVLEY